MPRQIECNENKWNEAIKLFSKRTNMYNGDYNGAQNMLVPAIEFRKSCDIYHPHIYSELFQTHTRSY